ncbi:DUF2946 family protein [Ketobacter sp.]|uniref:DUF2946 family protein n=1 Tax=Ketobacter sp. TaxID=2083498 RepID=UPI000F0D524A|nr:DUF2946 family protein [Ketobacter sp.]RLU01932.1 MAG: DUF2946 domain-containing protein [Ketobacter sp.]
MLALVWSLLSSTAHQHQDEPLGVHGDCVYCLVQQQVSGAAFLALGPLPVVTASPAPEPVWVAVPALRPLWVFHARAPPSRS